MRHLVRFLVLCAALGVTASSASAQIVWNVTYQDVEQSKTFGFNDPTVSGSTTVGQLRQDTVAAATNYLNTIVDARGTVDFNWQVSRTNRTSFAFAGTQFGWPGGQTTPVVGNVYRQAMGNPTTGSSGFGEMDFGYDWFATGLSGSGEGTFNQYDLYSVVLHELTHSLGVAATMNQDGSSSFGAGDPYSRYAQFLARGTNGPLLLNGSGTTFVGDPSTDTTSNDIYWAGTYGVAGNGGTRFKLYAPSSFSSGSSLSHLDESTFPNAVMSPQIANGQTTRTYTGREIGMLLDLGWNQFEWTGTTNGNWSTGTASSASSLWKNSAIQGTDQKVRAPLGTVTHNLVLHFGGTTAYTATNDLAPTFMLNRMIFFGAGSGSNITIAGAPGSKLEFGFDNNFNVTPQIEQRGSGIVTIRSDIALPNGLIVTDIGQSGAGQVNLTGVISGGGGLTKAGAMTLRIGGDSSPNTYSGLTTVQAGTLLLNKTSGPAMAGSLTIAGGTVELGAANQLPESGTVTLGGGTLKTNSHSDTAGKFDMTAASTIALGSQSHTLEFTGFNDEILTGKLTVTGWEGVLFGTGTKGRILFSGVSSDPNAAYTSWLGTVQFTDHGSGAIFLDTGTTGVYEMVPIPEPATVLAVAFGALGLGAVVRRRRRTSAGEAAIAP